jgi:hypothetical protein
MDRMKSIFLLLAAMAMPGAACAAGLTSQDAVYNLTLSKVRTHDVTGAVGQMTFNVVDGCTGWATTQHLTLLVRNVDGSLNRSVTNYVTWESKNGKTFTFSLRERDNEGKEQVDDAGSAVHTGDNGAGLVTYTTPANRQVALPPGTLFPMQHTEALLAAGRDGKKFIAPPLFDGTTADGAQSTFVAILGHQGPAPNRFAGLSDLPSSDVDIAFYPRKPGDQNPDFRTQMRYFENGVATNLVLDFGAFVMTGKLVHLTTAPTPCGKG